VSGLDDLAEAARNRGLKLVRSRVRTPGKRRFGKVGLTDASGKPVFGMDPKGPTAKPDEVEAHLRSLGASDWGASLGGAKPSAKSKRSRTLAAAKRAPPPPKPKLQIRDARPADAPALVKLINYLEHPIDEKTVRQNLATLRKLGETPLVAVEGKEVVGLIGIHKMVTIHRDAPVGRIPVLVVAERAQGKGIGKMLVEAAEALFRKAGCKLVEVTSNDRRTKAHAFYRHMGYERTSVRFAKTL
jgi:GNAT superfamily N-acetyltransferase